jgi:septum formation protein
MFMETILLASSSPRRREILESYGFPLLIRPSNTDERVWDHLPVRERVIAIAEDKAKVALASAKDGDPRWILAADTLVCVGDYVLGKPTDLGQARNFLRLLSGKTHLVSSGLAFADRIQGRTWRIVEETEVQFSQLSETEIEDYLDSREWEGVAGAYRIQGRAAFLIERVAGSFSCVMGLPLRAFYVILRQSGYRMR